MKTREIAVVAILASLAIGTNYALMPVYNVKLMDVIVFIGGFCFGPVVGALIGVTSWAVYGTINPLGFSFHVWLATTFAETIYGVAGAITRRVLKEHFEEIRSHQVSLYVFFGFLGVVLTTIYDVTTNIVFGYVSNWDVLFAVVVGFVPFGVVHMLSNAFIFGLGCIPAINAITNITGGESTVIPQE